jgi:hypothetical protein
MTATLHPLDHSPTEANAFTAVLQSGIIDDVYARGVLRIATEPEILSVHQAANLSKAACSVALMIDEAMHAVTGHAPLLRELGLDESLIAIAALDGPRWLGLSRADVFMVEGNEDAQVCELNCDTPTGLAECTELGRVAALAHPGLLNPSAGLRSRWIAMVRSAVRSDVLLPVVGILDPTEMTEDLCHVRLLARWLEEAGFVVVRGSPFNLHQCPDARVGLFGTPCDVLVRHYKTDWWARRSSPWLDQAPPPDSASLVRELGLVAAAQAAGTVTVVNPWGTVVAQNKRMLALPWEHPELFHEETLAAVKRHLPETRYVASLTRAQLLAEREQWVLKSDYGCEGEEVLVGSLTTPELWADSLRLADPRHWVVQRAFVPRRDVVGRSTNYGIFLIGGMPSGIYARRSATPTDALACSLPTLVQP